MAAGHIIHDDLRVLEQIGNVLAAVAEEPRNPITRFEVSLCVRRERDRHREVSKVGSSCESLVFDKKSQSLFHSF